MKKIPQKVPYREVVMLLHGLKVGAQSTARLGKAADMGSDPPRLSDMLAQRLGTSGQTSSEPLFICPLVGRTHLYRGHDR